jgi:uncharacterized protein (DUF983 family)
MTHSSLSAVQTAPSDHPAPVRWSSNTAAPDAQEAGWTRPGVTVAMARGLRGLCPCCGKGRLFQGWLRQVPDCAVCHAPLGAARGDDVPPYFVIFIVAHLVIGTQVLTDASLNLSMTAEAAIFLPLTLALCMGLLRPVKGATIGLMMQLGLVQPAIVAV